MIAPSFQVIRVRRRKGFTYLKIIFYYLCNFSRSRIRTGRTARETTSIRASTRFAETLLQDPKRSAAISFLVAQRRELSLEPRLIGAAHRPVIEPFIDQYAPNPASDRRIRDRNGQMSEVMCPAPRGQ